MTEDGGHKPAALFGAGDARGQMFDIVFKSRNLVQIVRCAALFSLAEHLQQPRIAADVAAAEGLDPDLTARFLRACVAFDLARLEPDGRFSGTPLLATLQRDDPSAMRDFAISQNGFGVWATWGRLDEALRTGRRQDEAVLGHRLWDYYAGPGGRLEGDAFSRALGGMTSANDQDAADLVDTRASRFAVDVGGGAGSVLNALALRNPALKGVVLDLPHVESVAQASASAAGVSERIGFTAGDFMQEAPAGDLYILRMILHDWSDEEGLRILRNCRRAAAPGARVIVIEMVTDPDRPDPMHEGQDINMLVMHGGEERSEAQFAALLREAGLRLDRRHATRTPFAILEAVLA